MKASRKERTPRVAARTIVLVWENLGPYHIDRIRALSKAGHRVVAIQFAKRSTEYEWDEPDSSGLDVRTLFALGQSRSPVRLAWRLTREIWCVGKADTFICHYSMLPVFVCAVILRLGGRRLYTLIDSKFDDYQRHIGWELIKKAFLAPYLGVMTASLRSRDYMRFLGFRPEQIALNYDAVSIDRIRSLSDIPPAPNGALFKSRGFIIVARFIPKKNIRLALAAYALWLSRTSHPRDLHLCGSGPLENDLRTQVDALGISQYVHFRGFLDPKRLSEQLARSIMLLLPSTEEQFGMVVVEAQALGLPVLIGRNAGACDTQIDPGVNGFVLDPNDASGWTETMLLLSEDEKRWRSFSHAANVAATRGDVLEFVGSALDLINKSVDIEQTWRRLA